jgi:hypothetical protein
MLHACVERFDVMGGRGNILGWDGEVNQTILTIVIKNKYRYINLKKYFFVVNLIEDINVNSIYSKFD